MQKKAPAITPGLSCFLRLSLLPREREQNLSTLPRGGEGGSSIPLIRTESVAVVSR